MEHIERADHGLDSHLSQAFGAFRGPNRRARRLIHRDRSVLKNW
jgi:hypothetical protein